MKRILHLTVYFVLLLGFQAMAQTTLNPNDPMVVYDPNNPPQDPPWGKIGKWVYTPNASVPWDHSSFKSYIYKGMAFRLKFPKTYQHNVADGKKYPVFLFFHGRGESRDALDNCWQLLNGGQKFRDAVDAGIFDGFLIYPQVPGLWGPTEYDKISEVLDSMAQYVKADLNRVTVNGLSAGGYASWEFPIRYPEKVAAAMPMSGVSTTYQADLSKLRFTAFWLFQGGLDGAPAPYTAETIVNALRDMGGLIKYTLYPNNTHNTWTSAWNEADFIPYMGRYNSLNPKALFQQTTFCAGETITIGIPPGYDGYQWQKDNVDISGATSNTLVVTTPGTYRVRAKRGTEWSEWSPAPLIITYKPNTAKPAISISGMASPVLPTPDGATSVTLQLPDNMVQYEWKRAGYEPVVGVEKTLTTSTVGKYVARVKANNNCLSPYSDTFRVVNANGGNGPDGISGLVAASATKTTIKLNWINVASPTYNEKHFEVYRATKAGGPYIMAGRSNTDVLTFTDQNLTPNTNYFYKVRPVNDNAAGPLSAEAKGTTAPDSAIPSAPVNLRLTSVSNNDAALAWNASTDDAGVGSYDIFGNGMLLASVNKNTLTTTINGLSEGTVYNFTVKAKDVAGKYSAPSNQLTVVTRKAGLTYKYYTGSWSNLPNFSTLTPAKTGRSQVPALWAMSGLAADNYAIMWTGFIRIPVSGTYKFETNSDEGSKFYFNLANYSSTATATVNNDGIHTARFRSGSVTVQAGIYPVVITYFERTGSQTMDVHWTCNELGVTSRQAIPGMYFFDTVKVTLTLPAAPGNLTAAPNKYSKINLNWQDNSNNETGFEIYRSTSSGGTYVTVGTVNANVKTYTDTALQASTTYYYKIRAIAASGESGFSNTASAQTEAKPPAPGAPTNLAAQALTTQSIKLTWRDNSAIETGFEIYRSLDGTNFSFLASRDSVAGLNGTATYTDVSLVANTRAWYKVRAVGEGGYSAYTATVNAQTLTNPPVIQPIPSQTIRYGTVHDITITATDPDNEQLTYSTINLPAFGSLVQNAGEVYLHLAPSAAQQGTYNNIGVIVTDEHNGKDTAYFNLVVNDNYPPVITPIADATVDEGATATLKLRVTDQNSGDSFTWTGLQLPSFVTLSSRDDSCLLTVTPGYTDAGAYTINVQVKDSKGGIDEKSFVLTIADKPSPNYKIFINLTQSGNGPAPWNNMNAQTISNLKNDRGEVTSAGLTFDSWWWATHTEGATTGNNSGVYPDVVMKEYLYFGSLNGVFSGPSSMTARLTNLETNRTYNIRFFSSSIWWPQADNGTTTYTINGVTKSLAVQGNTSNTVTFTNITPDASGTITFTLGLGANSTVGFLNAIEINANNGTSTGNQAPVITAIGNKTMSAGTSLQVPVQASDVDGDPLTYSTVNLPSFGTLVQNAGNIYLLFTPSAAQQGTYNNIRVIVADNKGAKDTATFNLVVNEAQAAPDYRILLNFTQSGNSPSPWNNVNGFVTSNLKDDNGNVTGVGISFDTWWWATSVDGATTGNNSGVYPDVVMKEYLYFGSLPGVFNGAPNMPARITGLDPAKTYSLKFFSSSIWWPQPDNGTTTFTINGVTKSIAVQNNTTNTVIFENLTPSASGEISFTVDKAAGTNVGFLNAMEINALGGNQALVSKITAPVVATINNVAKLGTNLVSGNMQLNAYPNPFVNNLAVDITLNETTDIMIEVLDMNGRNLHREYKPSMPQGKSTIRLNTMQAVDRPGTYLLKLTTAKGATRVVKVVKQ